MIRKPVKEQLHPRNRFRGGYDFAALTKASPGLAAFVAPNAHGDASIDYANPDAVKALNQALLKHVYGIDTWDVPPGYLCPPIPGRSDYLHYLADLLRGDGKEIPRGPSVRALDIGTGANGVYPLVGASEYGWSFVGTEIDPVALRWAKRLIAANDKVAKLIECRLQPSSESCFAGVIKPGEMFEASMCNPPFHASADEAADSTRRKRRHLGALGATKATMTVRNFGGQGSELWCEGGELGFVERMIAESAEWSHRCRWFTTLVSKSERLPRLQQALRVVQAADVKIIGMAQGQKQSRILAWTFQ
jgi:23S rRNA (adenine1618-N6)-methyltransferase